MKPKVRFAPSPTGTLHVGGARTALFNWLFARREKGIFVLRIEDTDLERSKEEYVGEILESLNWLGLGWDEGPYFQSQRLEIYQNKAEQLIREGKAYYAEESREGRRAILLKVPKEKITIHDFLRGEVSFDPPEDLVLIKSDGMPTYHFACVVDDAEMKITHVLRGDDHLSNTPKQWAIYAALDYPLPVFVHVPLILGADGTPLSKRHGAIAVSAFQKMGILPEALFNFLSLLGWSPGENLEILPQEELIQRFTLGRLLKKSSVFDTKKLLWINEHYLRQMPSQDFEKEGLAFLEHQPLLPEEGCCRALKLLQPRIQAFEDLKKKYGYFFFQTYPIDSAAVEKYLKTEDASSILAAVKELLQSFDSFDEERLEAGLRRCAEKLGLKAGALIHPLRVAVTGQRVSPGIFVTLVALGKDVVLERLEKTAINRKK